MLKIAKTCLLVAVVALAGCRGVLTKAERPAEPEPSSEELLAAVHAEIAEARARYMANRPLASSSYDQFDDIHTCETIELEIANDLVAGAGRMRTRGERIQVIARIHGQGRHVGEPSRINLHFMRTGGDWRWLRAPRIALQVGGDKVLDVAPDLDTRVLRGSYVLEQAQVDIDIAAARRVAAGEQVVGKLTGTLVEFPPRFGDLMRALLDTIGTEAEAPAGQ